MSYQAELLAALNAKPELLLHVRPSAHNGFYVALCNLNNGKAVFTPAGVRVCAAGPTLEEAITEMLRRRAIV